MGKKARRSEKFRRENPTCCYCGGSTETEDHVPPKAAFFHKRWPADHVFPACRDCNERTRDSDTVFGALVRYLGWDDELRDADGERSSELLSNLASRYPGAFPKQIPYLAESKIRRRYGISINDGVAVHIPNEAVEHVLRTFRKLGVAFRYRYTKLNPPLDHIVDVSLNWNAALIPTEDITEVFRLGRATHWTISSGRFNGQFIYSMDYNEDEDLFAVVAKFGGAFLGIASVFPGSLQDSVKPSRRACLVSHALSLAPPKIDETVATNQGERGSI